MEDEEKYQLISKTYTNYPVNVVAMRVGWIMTDDGKRFLQGILNSENLNLYEKKAMIVIIEYLYENYRQSILTEALPIYVA